LIEANPVYWNESRVDEHTFTNWFGDVGSDNHYNDKVSEDKNTLIGQWEWPGGGYEATMIRVRYTKMCQKG
jgi:hypothetical protein